MGGANAFPGEALFHMPFPGIHRACSVPPLSLPPSQVFAWGFQLTLVPFFIFTSFTPITAGDPLVSVGVNACLAPRICLRGSFLNLLFFEHQSSGSPSQCLSSTWLASFRPLCTVHPLAGWGTLQVQVFLSLLASQTLYNPLLLMHLHTVAGEPGDGSRASTGFFFFPNRAPPLPSGPSHLETDACLATCRACRLYLVSSWV